MTLRPAPQGHPRFSRHATGLMITVAGVVVMSFDSLLIRLIAADEWSLLAWRGLLMGTALTIGLIVTRGPTYALNAFAFLGLSGIGASVCYGFGVFGFISAIERISVATLLVVMAATPLFSALVNLAAFGGRTPLRTWIAIFSGMFGIAVATGGGFLAGDGLGIACAILAAFSLGTFLTILEHVKHIDTMAATALGSTIIGLVALGPGEPLSIDTPSAIALTLLMGLIVVPLAFGLFTLGPRYISSAESGLILLLETVLGPLWVWLVLSERPEVNAVIGGIIVLTTLALHTILTLRPPPTGRFNG